MVHPVATNKMLRDLELATRFGCAAGSVMRANIELDADPSLVLVQSGHERSSRGAATSRVVELRKSQSIRGKCIQIRGGNLTTVAADVGESHVIGHDQYNVGPIGR